MTKPQETRFTRRGDIHLAYQVIGAGPIDLVMLPSFLCHLDLLWEQDLRYRSWVRRLASFSRLILCDTRGAGLSDRDAGRLQPGRARRRPGRRARRRGIDPLRTARLLGRWRDAASPADGTERIRQLIDSAWGEGRTLEIFGPSLWGNPTALSRMARLERASLSPRAARTQLAWVGKTDVRADARDLQLPCMVLHRTNDKTVPVEYGRWLGFNIPNAQYVEQHDSDHLIWYGEQSETLDEIQKFLTGSVPDEDIDRFLATVLFTDIVGTTGHLARLGDRAWVETLARHHELVRRLLTEFHGQEQDAAGDGFFATFGLPARAVRCALAVRDAVHRLGIRVRIGVHTGECQRRGDTVVGISVHTAARTMAQAEPDEVLVSRTVTDLVAGSGLRFRDRGSHALKSVPGEWRLFSAG